MNKNNNSLIDEKLYYIAEDGTELPLEENISELSDLKDYNSEDDVSEEIVEEENTSAPEAIIGIIGNCVKLRVREKASINSEVIAELEAGKIVLINEEDSTDEFYSVYTEAGIKGFCMKKFVKINK